MPAIDPLREHVIGLSDAAELLGVCLVTARRWATSGKLRAQKVKGTSLWRTSREAVRELFSDDVEADLERHGITS